MVQATTPETAHMVAPTPNTSKMVKIKTLAPIVIKKNNENLLVNPGNVVEVTEEEACEYADKIFVGNYSVSGEHGEAFAEQSRHKTRRAVRV